jgi:hypothetical protein
MSGNRKCLIARQMHPCALCDKTFNFVLKMSGVVRNCLASHFQSVNIFSNQFVALKPNRLLRQTGAASLEPTRGTSF